MGTLPGTATGSFVEIHNHSPCLLFKSKRRAGPWSRRKYLYIALRREQGPALRLDCCVLHVFNEDAEIGDRIVYKDVGDCTYQLAVLNDWTAAHVCQYRTNKKSVYSQNTRIFIMRGDPLPIVAVHHNPFSRRRPPSRSRQHHRWCSPYGCR